MISNKDFEMLYGMSVRNAAETLKAVGNGLNNVTNHFGGDSPPSFRSEVDLETVHLARDHIDMAIKLLDRFAAATNWVPVRTARYDWQTTLPYGHPDRVTMDE